VAALWSALVAGIRERFERSGDDGRLPHLLSGDTPDFAACLLHQKLQMLNCCIFLIRHPDAAYISLSLSPATPDKASGLSLGPN
jgi:hypothetical protein